MGEIEELREILQDYEKRILKLESSKVKRKPQQVEAKKKLKSRPELITELVSEGFFKQPKFIGEIAKKCTEKTYKTKSTDLTLPLQNAVRSGILERVDKDGKWAYKAK